MRWTEAQFREYLAKKGAPGASPPSLARAGGLGRGQMPDRGMNKLEAAYDARLWLQRKAGAVLWHEFEAIKFRLADRTFYTPDFAVLPASSGILELHETKGYWREDARIKIKVAAAMYPFRFLGITRRKGVWTVEEF